jgi:hypothetical protein
MLRKTLRKALQLSAHEVKDLLLDLRYGSLIVGLLAARPIEALGSQKTKGSPSGSAKGNIANVGVLKSTTFKLHTFSFLFSGLSFLGRFLFVVLFVFFLRLNGSSKGERRGHGSVGYKLLEEWEDAGFLK